MGVYAQQPQPGIRVRRLDLGWLGFRISDSIWHAVIVTDGTDSPPQRVAASRADRLAASYSGPRPWEAVLGWKT